MSDSLGLVDFAIGLVIFVLNLPDGLVLFFEAALVHIFFSVLFEPFKIFILLKRLKEENCFCFIV